MKTLISLLSALVLMVGTVTVTATEKTSLYSAYINKDGVLESQSPDWIERVEYSSQPDYAASYKLKLMPGSFQQAPKFCMVSADDKSSYERTLYGLAKLSGKPTREEVNIIGLMLGLDGPSGDSSTSFYLVCGK